MKSVKENVTAVEFLEILKYVDDKVQKLSNVIKSRHLRKYERDGIKILESDCRNRRFRKRKRKIHDRERKKNWPENKRQIVAIAKSQCPDQNAIILADIEISDACKSLLQKGPSFVPTPYDIN